MVKRQVEQIRKLTNRPFAINFTNRAFLQTEHLMKRYSASLLKRPLRAHFVRLLLSSGTVDPEMRLSSKQNN
jgi:hypothetical protein